MKWCQIYVLPNFDEGVTNSFSQDERREKRKTKKI